MLASQECQRHEVIQAILDTIRGETYVEIGVAAGECFWRINAKRKIAVDPAPESAVRARVQRVSCRAWWRNGMLSIMNRQTPHHLAETELFEMTSDEFFAHHAKIFVEQHIDVALIDGLHTYPQSLRDVTHCLKYLGPRGVIVMHDCDPPSEAAAIPASSYDAAASLRLPGWTGAWCGDVWKTIIHLRSCREDVRVCVLDCDLGLGIVTRGKPEHMLAYSIQEVERLDYQRLQANRVKLLNVKERAYLHDVLNNLHDREENPISVNETITDPH